MLDVMTKSPGDHMDYDVHFSRWLPDDDEILTAVAVVSPAATGVEAPDWLKIASVRVTSPVVKVWLDGGLAGATYKVLVTASTAGGRVKQNAFQVRMTRDC